VDFPCGTGEGDSWEEGWFDYFWQPKGITPPDGQAINAAVLPLVEIGVGDRALWSDTPRLIDIALSNYGDRNLENATMSWKLVDAGRTLAADTMQIDQPMGKVGRVATITLPATGLDTPRKLDLVIEIDGRHANSWSFWSFPRQRRLESPTAPVRSAVKWAGIARLYPFVKDTRGATPGEGLLVTPALDEAAMQHLQAGGRVWLMSERGRSQDRSEVSFFPAAGGALGTVLADHPALAEFPHEGIADLQFYNVLDGAAPIPLDRWPTALEPIVGGIRTKASFLAKTKDLSRVGYVFEAKVGPGRLLVTSLRLRDHFDEAYPEALTLFDRLLRYASGPDFAPAVEVGTDQLRPLMAP
jgi:beta-galactosidase